MDLKELDIQGNGLASAADVICGPAMLSRSRNHVVIVHVRGQIAVTDLPLLRRVVITAKLWDCVVTLDDLTVLPAVRQWLVAGITREAMLFPLMAAAVELELAEKGHSAAKINEVLGDNDLYARFWLSLPHENRVAARNAWTADRQDA